MLKNRPKYLIKSCLFECPKFFQRSLTGVGTSSRIEIFQSPSKFYFQLLFRFQWYTELVYGQWILNASTVYVELQMFVNSIIRRNFSDLNQSIDLTINRSRKVNGWKYFCICVWKNALVEQASRQLVYIEWAITQNSKKCQNQWQLAQTIQIWHYLSHWLVVGSMKQETLRQGAQSPLFWGDRLEYD